MGNFIKKALLGSAIFTAGAGAGVSGGSCI